MIPNWGKVVNPPDLGLLRYTIIVVSLCKYLNIWDMLCEYFTTFEYFDCFKYIVYKTPISPTLDQLRLSFTCFVEII